MDWLMSDLVGEPSVLVGSEQGGANAGQSLGLAHLEPLVESVVELDLAATASEEDASSAACMSVNNLDRENGIRTTLLAGTPSRQ